MTGISHMSHCCGNSVAMATRVKINNSFVLSRIEFTFGMEVSLDDRHQPYPLLLWLLSCHGNQQIPQ